jgi:peptide-methionine (R)-S-oxide reductase
MLLDEETIKNKLTENQYKILRQKDTEIPFSSPLLNDKSKGMFTCALCENPLFSHTAKFDSGTGWPSFDEALPGAVEFITDDSYGMHRTEVVCAKCQSHLGHIFNDGPKTTGKRFCINGACLVKKVEI